MRWTSSRGATFHACSQRSPPSRRWSSSHSSSSGATTAPAPRPSRSPRSRSPPPSAPSPCTARRDALGPRAEPVGAARRGREACPRRDGRGPDRHGLRSGRADDPALPERRPARERPRARPPPPARHEHRSLPGAGRARPPRPGTLRREALKGRAPPLLDNHAATATSRPKPVLAFPPSAETMSVGETPPRFARDGGQGDIPTVGAEGPLRRALRRPTGRARSVPVPCRVLHSAPQAGGFRARGPYRPIGGAGRREYPSRRHQPKEGT